MKIISIVNQKGGTAKTTTAINLGTSLAYEGKKVLLIDIDPQSNLTVGLDINVLDGEKTIYNCLMDEMQLDSAIHSTNTKNLDIVPATINLANAELELTNIIGRETVLRDSIEISKNLDYDYVLIDCNPSLGLLTINALSACDKVLIPLEASIFSFQGINNLIKVVNLVKKKLNKKIAIGGVLLTRVDSRTNISKDFEEQLKEIFKEKVFETIIHQNVKIAEAQVANKAVIEFAKESKGAKEYLALAREVISREQKS
jgi:chromosome partitioning protein